MTSHKSLATASHSKLKSAWRLPGRLLKAYWRRGLWQKLLTISFTTLLVCLSIMYGIARWYIWSERTTPFVLGTSFVPAYAQSLGVDPKETLDALADDIGIRDFRLVSYWNQMEPQPGIYDFSQLDWQFKKIEAVKGHVTLSLGLRQPRYPECHMPDWARSEPPEVWKAQLNTYIAAVVDRYKNSPALQSYQVENEFFLKGFGICETIPGALDRSRLISEYALVKQHDSKHTVIINRSNNALGWPVGDPQPDEFGISVYKRVWDQGFHTHRYLEYPFPAWFYAFTAGWTKIATGKDTIIHEMQAESWAPNSKQLNDISVAEADKSLDSKRLSGRVRFAEGTGMKEVYLWGSEYWYYRDKVQHDPSLMNVAREEFKATLKN
ncbi:beta-galactosidase [Aeromicrobium sp.]|nr:beta-galactosidase [Candidatus Saccharibacteria bacterium]